MKEFLKKNMESVICYGFCTLLIISGIFIYRIIF